MRRKRYTFRHMRDDLVLLASSNSQGYRGGIDKHLAGYATVQFVTGIQDTLFLAYDE